MNSKFSTHYKTIVKADAAKVWNALTDPALVKQYFFGTDLVTDWKVGKPIFFRGSWEETTYEDKGIVQSFVPNKSLSYSYLSSFSGLPDLPENYLEIKYELMPVAGGTELTISQTNYDEEKAKHSEGNWAMVIDGMKKLIE